ncbi:hypothetical protein [Paenibacillus radicis (ex Xue et al. 2023)]|uniref:Uncharacterized protein n=1 Tax=Paenibacillus radicis (ex Xue et al. 2023) TaxID=2972489 RepID=A0ABT1YL77_9BACL|nr:hypothetical protein [Paenibacillus radicis (ex Xue et al. 2023)]MCR8633934.1 hypothetical protein [Paenibacillus radicis (ex Xue et al. 2023)]
MSETTNPKPSMKQAYFNQSSQEADLQHRIKTLQHLQQQIIQSALLLGSILHTDTLSDVVEALHKMRSDLERQALSLKLKQSILISDSNRGTNV